MGAVFSPIVHPFSKPFHRTIPKSVAVLGGAPATPFVATPSTETPVAGVDVTWSTNAGDLGTPVSYTWDFGDGTIPVTGATPSHYFVGPGPYTVTCVVTYDDDSTDTDTQVITLQTTEVITLLHQSYTAGTSYDLNSFLDYGATFNPNTVAAPDGTTTAGTFAEDATTAAHDIYLATPSGFASDGTYHLVFYAKTVDMAAISVTCYKTSSENAFIELNLSTKEVSAGRSKGVHRIVGSSAYDAGNGWTRISVSLEMQASPAYIWVSASDLSTAYNASGEVVYLGTNKSCYIWGLHSGSGVDDYSPATHYLGEEQTPAPTSTVNVLRERDGQTAEHTVDFGLGDLTASNYNTTYDFDIGALSAGYAYPIGSKIQSEATSGFHQRSRNENWLAGYSIGIPFLNGRVRQVGAWIYLEQAPATYITALLFYTATGSRYQGFSINSDLELTARDYNGSDTATIFAGPLPVKEWFWLGMAQVGGLQKLMLRTRSGGGWTDATAVLVTDVISANFDSATNLCFGPFNTAGNAGHYTRIASPTFHLLDSLDAAGYPSEIVPPQEGHMIYSVNPDTGDDANDGITAPWQTITKVVAMFAQYGVIEDYTANTNGSANYLEIDTSTAPFVVDTVPLYLYRNGTWLKPPSGQSTIEFKAYELIDAGDWSVTGGYSDIYEVACIISDQTTVFGDNVYFEPVVDLAALDAAAGGASWVNTATSTLYVKTLGLTDPRVDGITYIRGKLRLGSIGDPVVSIAAASCRISDCVIWYTAVNNNGSYAIGEITGFTEGALIERCSSRYGDKHGICFTANATDTTIDIVDCDCSLCRTYPFTSFMFTGSGNIHNYIRCTSDVAILEARSATGLANNVAGNGPGAFYSHGAGNTFSEVNFIDCQFGGSIESEYAATVLTTDADTVAQFMRSLGALELTGSTFRDIPSMDGGGTATGISVVSGNTFSTPRKLFGSMLSSTFDLRTLTSRPGLWTLFGATTFTGNTVRFAAGQSSPIIKDSAASDIVSCNNNTYYIEANAIFAKNFDSGSGPEDLDWAGWQGKGFDLDSDRFDPV